MKKALVLFLGLLCTMQCLPAQSFFQITSGKPSLKVPFELYRNIIIVPVFLNGSGPYNFILDTGAGHCIITDPQLVDSLGLSRGKSIAIKGPGSMPAVEAYLVHSVVVNMDGLTSLPLTFSAFNEDPFLISEYLGVRVHGILGYEFFSSFAVEIHFDGSYLKVYDPDRIKINRKWQPVPLIIEKNKPFIRARTISDADTNNILMLLDTGAGFPISVELHPDSTDQVPAKHIATELGVGLSGPVDGYLARISEFQIADFAFKNIVTGFQLMHPEFINEIQQGSIGNFILNRFTIILDYSSSIIYFKPGPDMNNKFPYNRSGVELIAAGKDLQLISVYWVRPGSWAEKMDIQQGDIILEINNKPAAHYSFEAIDQLLSNPKSESVFFKILRGESIFYTIVILEDII